MGVTTRPVNGAVNLLLRLTVQMMEGIGYTCLGIPVKGPPTVMGLLATCGWLAVSCSLSSLALVIAVTTVRRHLCGMACHHRHPHDHALPCSVFVQ